jgi:putative endonuclease
MDTRTDKRRLGDLGERVAKEFLMKRGFRVIDTNYLRKWGEIDIIAEKDGLMRFIEVKSVSVSSLPDKSDISRDSDSYRPEDNMHPWKLKRLSRAIQTYLLEKNIDKDWQLDVVTVRIDERSRVARAELIENVII